MFYLKNTITGKKEPLKSKNKKITLYVCGITPYDYSHIGHARCYVVFDALYRFLKFLGYTVTYCRNFTDIDDKLLNKAEAKFHDCTKFREIANEYINFFHQDMRKLNCLSPDIEPKVTDNIPEIIYFIERLIQKGFAYESGGDVYFSIKDFPQYGILSKHDVEDLRSGVRVEIRTEKKDVLDFALWKHEKESRFWDSPWGNGRPGWHIECSALAHKFLGETVTIHGGGLDLQFPHHENEIAQSEALHGKTFVEIWMHNGLVKSNHEKMSKSIGNVFRINELCNKFDPMAIRYYLLTHHYRAPIEFNLEDITATQKAYEKLCDTFASSSLVSQQEVLHDEFAKKLFEYLYDDLNVGGMIGYIFKELQTIKNDPHMCSVVKTILSDILGLTLQPITKESIEVTPEIQKLLDEREVARREKNWIKADEIRDALIKLGVSVQDKKL